MKYVFVGEIIYLKCKVLQTGTCIIVTVGGGVEINEAKLENCWSLLKLF